MPCLLALFALGFPRLILFLVWLFNAAFFSKAFTSGLFLLLGFIFMPLTTLAYAWAVNANGSVSGGYLIVVIIAVLIDLGLLGGGGASARKKRMT